jgi:hypothetical protein
MVKYSVEVLEAITDSYWYFDKERLCRWSFVANEDLVENLKALKPLFPSVVGSFGPEHKPIALMVVKESDIKDKCAEDDKDGQVGKDQDI